ncbi:MAG TPA: DUF922 domain-containing protein [Puia sp.]|nr:DUF922 domain-containing protein [Puia sp.]
MSNIFFSVSIALLTLTRFHSRDDQIEWSAVRKLTWTDFKQRPDPSSPNAALTSSIIKYDFGYNDVDGLSFHIHCEFDPEASWGRTKTDYILSHEQGHFDITEIYARKLDKAFKEYKPTPDIKKKINKIYMGLMAELHEYQEKYDAATNFSLNHDKQQEWLQKISNQLKELEPYSNYH